MVEQRQRPPRGRTPSLGSASGAMAVATMASRISGLFAKVLLVWVLGLGMINDSYTVANTLPTVVNELLLGGVLTSVAVPLLVGARQNSEEEGESYAQWMITMGVVLLVVATTLAVLGAPLLTELYLGSHTRANSELTTAFAYLLLPGIVFYGLSALLMAILNVRQVFGPPAWAPVMNNLVIIATVSLYAVTPGEISADPVRMGQAKLLILGLGTMLGIAAQSAVMVLSLRRTGFRFRWRWGWDRRLAEFGSLAGWVVLYTVVSQIGMIVTIRVAGQGTSGSVATFHYAWLLSQVPYGVLGVSLLQALMPRISRSIAEGDTEGFVRDVGLGSRLSAILLMPVSAFMLTAGSGIGVAFFSLGQGSVGAADRLGVTLGVAAAGIVPFSITMLQLRAFYAMKDARTPMLINVIMVVFRTVVCYTLLMWLDPRDLVIGVALAMSLSFLVGAAVGQWWLHIRLGRIQTRRTLVGIGWSLLASVVGCGCAYAVWHWLGGSLHGLGEVATAWVGLGIRGTLVLGLGFGLMLLLPIPEMTIIRHRLRGLLNRV
ncbi:putative peptidoglycan lipid II flippase [Actinopolyspora alba]|uniref:Putative peptidoglycan lipid II flippase n=1 Tax=Actinopolyspora alba TaxID=673379 RepID=A0A1I1X0C4_9ACTN|nr:murein biosynthesis integral membrane protein MurJ [Actinopolyspora alba]SFD98800.1 putative peptidoglycan lipid II flippase [Actinopolyspora alba]